MIAYADRFGGSLNELGALMRSRLGGVFEGVHVLPFYAPFDGADAGFDPIDHTAVDPRLGTWEDLGSLSTDMTITADLIVNHMSVGSAQFKDVLVRGDASPWSPMFLTMRDVFPTGASEEDLVRIYRPRPGLPFTRFSLGGQPRLVWTTFTDSQVDLDVTTSLTWAYLCTVIDRLASAGASVVRLDAIGYTRKVRGTNCFLTPETLVFMDRVKDYCHRRGMQALLEVHGHFSQQIELAADADLIYDFALPPLVLYAVLLGDPAPLGHWLGVRPANAVTVLDTHDGIGVIDAGPNELRPSQPGLLDGAQIAALVEAVHLNTDGVSRRATGAAASNLDLYQVNTTFFDACGRDPVRYLMARAIQLFTPGIPQVYYVGLLAGTNDTTLFEQTGVGRDVNRHRYSLDEVERRLTEPVVRAQLALLQLRASHPAFHGAFSYVVSDGVIELSWADGVDSVLLTADVATSSFSVRVSDGGARRLLKDVDLLSS